ncbi:antifreeze protein Maxi-like [Cylas formicarius]|uniref:antifreeze protein Maxi-like n=1 Tax=Cylas formicarius TaxID=197179 RepID=UPI002958D602|nr:antifreeze protein Maxi-like [Cylas formicarius]
MIFCGAGAILFLVAASLASNIAKRGVFDSGYGYNSFDSYGPSSSGFSSPSVSFKPYHQPVSPAEIASAIQAAKEASSAVMSAQRRVQDAKEDVLHQQHVASQKQADAALALQKTEAAAAVQQQEAKSAATALVRAQQRLAQAKAEVSEAQRIAAAKEAHAAAVIQKSAAAAAHEIQKTDDAARKIQSIQSSGSSAIRQAAAAKQGSLTATSAAVAAAVSSGDHSGGSDGSAGPWYGQKVIHLQPWG